MAQNVAIAVQAANVTHRGERIHIPAGSAWDANDPLVRDNPSLFTLDDRALRRTVEVVEQATRAPGEKRGTRR